MHEMLLRGSGSGKVLYLPSGHGFKIVFDFLLFQGLNTKYAICA